jgi:hypothetical protein
MSFTQRTKTPKNSKIKYLTEYPDYYNTFNKAKFSSFRYKIKKSTYKPDYNNYRSNQNNFNTFYKSTAPFNYINNKNNKDGLLVCYNGGPRKQFRPLITKDNLNQILKNRRSISTRYKRPCGCYSNYNISKYSQEYIYPPNYERNEQYNNFYKSTNLPYIGDNVNERYSNQNAFITPRMENRKITYKLKDNDNFNDDNYRINTEANNYQNDNNIEMEKNEENQNENKGEVLEEQIEEKKEEIKEEQSDNYKKSFNYFNLKPRRRFHKIQIFNNCKPFLVDDFKDYGYYE